ncbi:MAG: 2-C-methyl-D-erythritol 4-phosphate cytidylyltransferase [Cyclobacteriaceae bacterium]|nr:2-C-methyl-D-erythritol 4-phosphate cytidylyltransferase [Cyclobacteriaceae bacterium]MCH8514994.1 2-C-methyl-D-erythritol 4-phosphate cytidylyltransferase [Cyclobacteriaceae bacterium]
MNTNRYALIVAGGSGSRMQSQEPKQFLPLAGKPVLMHTLALFSDYQIVLVLPQKHIDRWKELCATYHFHLAHEIVAGGSERSFSVQNGLEHIPDHSWVAIHDGVRPLASRELIDKCFIEAEKVGNAVAMVPLKDSLRMLSVQGTKAADRSQFMLVQTPQVFRSSEIKLAYLESRTKISTDDATIFEENGNMIHAVTGEYTNIKITTKGDLVYAESLLDIKEKA